MLDTILYETYNGLIETGSEQQEGDGTMGELAKIELTENPLQNIVAMAPYLDEADQNKVFGMILGLLGYSGKKEGRG